MTLTGYKPALILPWYTVENNNTVNETRTNSERKVLGEPGPLRIMVYTGPIIMGVGFFGIMMAVVLFCEIKDRYLMAILPTKGEIRKIKKDMLYDMIINEFRKNYFRGIEVPIRKEDDKKHGFKKWSFSFSGSGGSFISFARCHSHDLYKLVKRKHKSKEKWKNATFPKRSISDAWMKTSSLPNIKQKYENVELEILPHGNQNVMDNNEAKDLQDVKMTTEVSSKEDINARGVDNFAYNDSPSNKKTNIISCKTSEGLPNAYTTAVVHTESNFKEAFPCVDSAFHSTETIKDIRNTNSTNTESDKKQTDVSLNVNTTLKEYHGESNHTVIVYDTNNEDHNDQNSDYKRDDPVDTLGMTSDTSSLTLSWEGGPLEWSDARRNTEPCALFQLTLGSNSSESNEDISQTTNHKTTTTKINRTIEPLSINKQSLCTFKTVIRVFHSESSLSSS